MNFVKLTPYNVYRYVGHDIIFKTRNDFIIKTINGVSPTGKTVHIDHPDLNNSLQIVTRNVYAIIPENNSNNSNIIENFNSYYKNCEFIC